MNAVTAGVLTAELRKRLAETHNLDVASPGDPTSDHGSTLGAMALRRARLATAVHMTAAARSIQHRSDAKGETS